MALPVSTARFGTGEVAVAFEIFQHGEIAFCAPVQLSEVDLVAALWLATSHGVAAQELADPTEVRIWVADALVNSGLDAVNDARYEVARVVPGTEDHAWLQQIQGAVRRAFGPVLPGPARRTLVGVA